MRGESILLIRSLNILPILSARSLSFSSLTTSRAAMATLQPSGLPPKVLPCSPGLRHIIISSFANTALTGNTPPLNALPRTKISGFTPSCSQQISFPVLATPVCTSSAMKSTFLLLHSSLAFFKYPSSGTTTPASPCIGSTMKPATLGSSRAFSKAARSL